MTLDDGPIKAPPPESPGKDAAATNRVLGTLVVVVLRAKNLTNRVRIGKQNPYTTVTYGLNKKRTETIERGGQQPTWDTEFRFEILKDSAEQLAAEGKALVNKHGGVMPVAAAGEAAARLQQQHAAGATAASGAHAGKKVLRLACYADDPKDPKLVGEGTLDLESTIKKGAFDGELGRGCVHLNQGLTDLNARRLGETGAERSIRGRDLSRADVVLEREPVPF